MPIPSRPSASRPLHTPPVLGSRPSTPATAPGCPGPPDPTPFAVGPSRPVGGLLATVVVHQRLRAGELHDEVEVARKHREVQRLLGVPGHLLRDVALALVEEHAQHRGALGAPGRERDGLRVAHAALLLAPGVQRQQVGVPVRRRLGAARVRAALRVHRVRTQGAAAVAGSCWTQTSATSELDEAVVRPLRWSRFAWPSLPATPVDTGPEQSADGSASFPPRQTSATPLWLRDREVPSLSVAQVSAYSTRRHTWPSLPSQSGASGSPKCASSSLPESACAPSTSWPPRASSVASDRVLSSSSTLAFESPTVATSWPAGPALDDRGAAVVGSGRVLGLVAGRVVVGGRCGRGLLRGGLGRRLGAAALCAPAGGAVDGVPYAVGDGPDGVLQRPLVS